MSLLSYSQFRAFVIITITRTLLPVTCYQFRILVLLPLSGPDQINGHAVKAGINTAWKEEVARLNTPHDIEVDIVYEDTQCSSVQEKAVLLHQLRDTVTSPGQLIIFSYNCEPASDSSLLGLGLLDVPVITFGREITLSKYGFTGRQSVPGVFEKLSELLKRNNWKEVGASVQPGNSVLEEILNQELKSRDIEITNNVLHSLTVQRVWVLIGDLESIANTVCTYKGNKFIWVIPTIASVSSVLKAISRKCGINIPRGFILVIEANILEVKIPSYFSGKLREEGFSAPTHRLEVDAAHAYDISRLVLGTLYISTRNNSQRRDFTKQFSFLLKNTGPFQGLTGTIDFDHTGVRIVPHTVYSSYGNTLRVIDESVKLEMGPATSSSETRLDGIPIWLLALMSSLAILGIIYALAIIIFNLAKAKNKIIKMTSPNINVVMLIGAILGYSCIIMFGLDSGYVSRTVMEKLQTSCVFILALSFTVIYGCLFAKSWRVFLVFKNINFNGKLTRDEHLLIGILVMLLIDLAILLPWYFVDPIECTNRTISTVYEADTTNTVTYEVDDCYSELQGLWIALLYIYKLLLIIAGLYFTWQTRNITLPSLKDTKLIYIVVFCIMSTAIIALPTILITYVGMKTRYASGGLIIWIVLTVTITVLFVPKIMLERKNRDASNNISAFNFLFSESMRKTQEAVRKCSLCFCCGDANDSDRYVQEMLANEIDTLKRTIKQKDASIRELNDRLYIGTEKFHEYLTSPKSNRSVLHAMQEKYESKKKQEQRQKEQQEYSLNTIERSNEVQIHCPQPRNANGFIPNNSPHAFTSTPQRPSVADNGYHQQQQQHYEDEGIHSSDSYLPNSAHSHGGQEHYHSNNINNHFSSHQNLYKPIQTVSNGYIPRSGSTASGYHHVRNHSQASVGSQRSLPSNHTNHINSKNQMHQSYKQEWRPPSPNQDSAFDDNTPSSDGYDKYSGDKIAAYDNQKQEFHDYQHFGGSGGIAQERQFSQIDIGAMEYDAVRNFQRTPSFGHKYEPYKQETAIPAYYSNAMNKNNVLASQI